MKVFFMNGGLGNQLYQYIFMRWMELKGSDECMIDDSAFFGDGVPHNGYEIARLFGLKPRLMSETLSPEMWQKMLENKKLGVTIPQQILDDGNQLAMVYESGDTSFNGNIIHTDTRNMALYKTQGNVYFHGYWMIRDYFNEIEATIRQELLFPEVKDMRNKMYAKLITESESVAVHVRRGDMVALGWSKDVEYFKRSVERMEGKLVKPHYFIFSDDLPWCKEHRGELGFDNVKGMVTFIDGNRGSKSYIDLQLMAMCKHDIISRSSFSLLASMLNVNSNKIVIRD